VNDEFSFLPYFRGLSAKVSTLPGFEAKKSFLLAERATIDATILAAVVDQEPLEAYAAVDGAKSIIGRELLLRSRLPTSSTLVVHGTKTTDVEDLLRSEPDLYIVNFYYHDSDFWGFCAYTADKGGAVVEKVTIASGETGTEVVRGLRLLADTRIRNSTKDFEHIVSSLLQLFGQVLLPRIARLTRKPRLILVPHKLLYLLPLHGMFVLDHETESIAVLDQFTTSVSYASSHLAFQYARVRITPSFTYERGRFDRIAAPSVDAHRIAFCCVDAAELGTGGQCELDYYRDVFGEHPDATIVTDAHLIPTDFSEYYFLLWSSHARSNPTTWRDSALYFGQTKISATQILENWFLRNVRVALLMGCETGVDLAIDEAVDEYFGLEAAIQIAGASTVVSTMWKVRDTLAAFLTIFVSQGLASGIPVGRSLRSLRFLLMGHTWRQEVEKVYRQTVQSQELSEDRKRKRLKWVSPLLDLPSNEFQGVSNWWVFRNMGHL